LNVEGIRSEKGEKAEVGRKENVHVSFDCLKLLVRCQLIMAALWNRTGHYIFALWFLSFFLSFFPGLISAAADWISTILSHMVWT